VLQNKFSVVRKGAFILLEILVVVVTIVILIAMVLPVIFRSMSRSSKIGCVNMLKQQGIAFRIFSTDNGSKYSWAMEAFSNGPVQGFALQSGSPSPIAAVARSI
jgi:competence protein ComGC